MNDVLNARTLANLQNFPSVAPTQVPGVLAPAPLVPGGLQYPAHQEELKQYPEIDLVAAKYTCMSTYGHDKKLIRGNNFQDLKIDACLRHANLAIGSFDFAVDIDGFEMPAQDEQSFTDAVEAANASGV